MAVDCNCYLLFYQNKLTLPAWLQLSLRPIDKMALEKYQYFVGDLWEREGEPIVPLNSEATPL
jgi:hypothetical protein